MTKFKRHIVGIVGPTGAGKTTLAEGLARHYQFQIHREEPLENPYWKLFYAELQKGGQSPIALKSQLFFLLAAQKQAQAIAEEDTNVVWDVPLFGHKMYADLLFKQGVMPPEDYALYCDVYAMCLQTIPMPDLLLVATTDLKTLQARIVKRGREVEIGTPAEYWRSQIQYWEDKIAQPSQIPLLKVDSAEINWTNHTGVSQVWALANSYLA